MIPQKHEIIKGRGLKMAKAEVWLWLHTTLSSTVCDIKKQKDQFRSFIAWHESVKGLFDNKRA